TWTGIAARARVLLVNADKIAGRAVSSVRDLAEARFKGAAALASPVFGTTTMHVAALAAAWGDGERMKFLDAGEANGARVAGSNGEAKRLVCAGEVAIALTDTDDADEAVKEGAHVRAVVPDQEGPDALGTLVMPSSVVMLARAPHAEAAKKLIDALLASDTE